MLGIILLILKIIGIAIAAILGLLLFVVLLVLFVPIRYRGEVHKRQEIQAEGKVSWLLGVILFRIRYTEQGTKYALRICGFKLFSDEPRKRRRKPKEKIKAKKIAVEEAKEIDEKGVEEVKNESAPVQLSKGQLPEKNVAEESQEKQVIEETAKKKSSIKEKWKDFCEKVKSIKRKIRDMLIMIKGIFHKIGAVKRFIFDYHNRPGFKVIFREVKALLKHIFPTKYKAYIHFGMEDPSQTGQILGAVCAIYPSIISKVSMYPDFEQEILEGDFEGRGRIRIFTVLVMVLRVVMNKEFKIVWNNIKNLKEEL